MNSSIELGNVCQSTKTVSDFLNPVVASMVSFSVLTDSVKHLFNGGAAGMLAKLAVYPFDLTKKRLEVVSFEEARSKFGQVQLV
jgi:hypothetical protein